MYVFNSTWVHPLFLMEVLVSRSIVLSAMLCISLFVLLFLYFNLSWPLCSLVLCAMFCRLLFVLLFFNLNWPLCSLVLCAMFCRLLFVLLFFNLSWPLCSLVLCAMFCRSLFVLLFLYFNLNWPMCSLVLCAMFCRSLFVLLFFNLNWALCCLSFDLPILITPLLSSNSPYTIKRVLMIWIYHYTTMGGLDQYN